MKKGYRKSDEEEKLHKKITKEIDDETEMGMEIEGREHTSLGETVIRQLVKDHLKENKHYYSEAQEKERD